MWEQIVGNMPSGTTFFCAFLSAFIPYIVYFVNQRLHQYGDPPWVEANAPSKDQSVNAGGQRPNQKSGGGKQSSNPEPTADGGTDKPKESGQNERLAEESDSKQSASGGSGENTDASGEYGKRGESTSTLPSDGENAHQARSDPSGGEESSVASATPSNLGESSSSGSGAN
ncbi:hypothetical protein [Paenibacillus methanolicus]|uniref:Uncharacterized protein n=1 Tax=Paenibacillus methanolicus TaxID=582686 RepID=A0A5S5BZE8_9BACL|nr:hypothetical protein [Paenibacillus methanolicus]TYP72427.1 hypothetical protein BCM02_10881 [Paenibacillus methanolicus]